MALTDDARRPLREHGRLVRCAERTLLGVGPVVEADREHLPRAGDRGVELGRVDIATTAGTDLDAPRDELVPAVEHGLWLGSERPGARPLDVDGGAVEERGEPAVDVRDSHDRRPYRRHQRRVVGASRWPSLAGLRWAWMVNDAPVADIGSEHDAVVDAEVEDDHRFPVHRTHVDRRVRHPVGEVEEEARHPCGPDDRPPGGPALGAAVAEQHHIRIEQGEQRVDVAAARRRQQLHQQVRAGRRHLRRSGGADLDAGPMRDLAAVVLRLADRGGDLRERLAEHVGEKEHGALGCREGVEHDEEAERQGFGDLGGGGRITVGECHRLGQPRADVVLAAAGHGAEAVERQPGRRGGQPRGGILDDVRSVPDQRSQASWTTSSASASDPNMR